MGISTPTGWGSSLLRVYTTQALHVFPRKTIKGTGIAFFGRGWNSLSTLKRYFPHYMQDVFSLVLYPY